MITFNPSQVHPFQKLSLMQNPVAINCVCICALVSGVFSISQHVQQFGTFSRPSRLIQRWQPKKQLINSQFSTGNHLVPYIFGDSCQQHGQCTTLCSWIQSHFRSGLRFQIQLFKRSRNQPRLITLIRRTTDDFPPSFTGVRQVAHHRANHAEPITILNRSCISWQPRQINSPESFRWIFATSHKRLSLGQGRYRRRKWWQHRRWRANVPYNISTSHNRHSWRWSLGTNSSTTGPGTETKELCDPCEDGSFFMPFPFPPSTPNTSRPNCWPK